MQENKHNIIFITIDCLRADYVNEHISPNITKLAKDGCTFKNAIATGSWTPASFKSIFASVYPFNNKARLSVKYNKTLAEILKNEGYKTIGIQDNPWLSKLYGYGKGFDIFTDNLDMSRDLPVKNNQLISSLKKVYLKLNPKYRPSFVNTIYAVFTNQHTKTAEHLTQYALDMLKNVGEDKPFFMWIHYLDAHEPYYPNNANIFKKIKYARLNEVVKDCKKVCESDVNILNKEYISKINYIDKQISLIIDYIGTGELKDNTSIVITADHGQQFFEHCDYRGILHRREVPVPERLRPLLMLKNIAYY